ncbi:hypothetical protein [Dyella silvatica]|uniref:hypothetical protein n=1 Tax=Dyella silvatica TaxID=2992128 RepID=UPI00225004FF|nr:hypothetical protein [Dyella silvatica]
MTTDFTDQDVAMIEKRPTAFEWALYLWFCINVALCVWAIATHPVEWTGVGWTVWVLPLAGTAVTILLLGYLLRPTWAILTLAAIYFAFQVIEIRLPGQLYAFRVGLTVDYDLVRNPTLLVKINFAAIATASLYAVAAYHRFEEEGP